MCIRDRSRRLKGGPPVELACLGNPLFRRKRDWTMGLLPTVSRTPPFHTTPRRGTASARVPGLPRAELLGYLVEAAGRQRRLHFGDVRGDAPQLLRTVLAPRRR